MPSLDDLVERDGGACVWCGRSPWRSDLSVEHLCPRSRRGRGEPENVVVACRGCNRSRRSRSAVSFARDRERDGFAPRWARLAEQLEALAASPRRAHRTYGRAQLRHLS